MPMDSKVTVDIAGVDKKDYEAMADKEISDFEMWYTRKFTGQAPLTRYERAILKTFLMFHINRAWVANL
jgi:hypothetical protein